ncbi:hypothetical protein ACUWEX_11125 [Okibacterium fritillariae]|uniref:hypothetical protein n=1 Tax=Okibacterium fritillariae TaxID=123320 RepID=UPI00405549CD
MTNATNTKTAPAADDIATIERTDVSRTIALVRHELTEIFNDAKRARPFFAPSKREAEGKLAASLKALTEFAESLDAIKKR